MTVTGPWGSLWRWCSVHSPACGRDECGNRIADVLSSEEMLPMNMAAQHSG